MAAVALAVGRSACGEVQQRQASAGSIKKGGPVIAALAEQPGAKDQVEFGQMRRISTSVWCLKSASSAVPRSLMASSVVGCRYLGILARLARGAVLSILAPQPPSMAWRWLTGI